MGSSEFYRAHMRSGDDEPLSVSQAATGATIGAYIVGGLSLIGTVVTTWLAVYGNAKDATVPTIAAAAVGLLLIFAFTCILYFWMIRLRRAVNTASYYMNESRTWKQEAKRFGRMAYLDTVTGLPNSYALSETLDHHRSRQACLVLIDLVNFRAVNKAVGMAQADRYLRAISNKIEVMGRRDETIFVNRATTTGDDTSGDRRNAKTFRRYPGGDEFYVLLEGDVVDGIGYLNRLVKSASILRELSYQILGDNYYAGFCAGLVSFQDESVEGLVSAVSDRLRLAQETHRPMFVYWDENELAKRTLTQQQSAFIEEARKNFAREAPG